MASLKEMARNLSLVGLVEFLVSRWRLVAAGLLVVILAGVGWFAYDWYRTGIERAGEGALVQAYQEIRKVEESPEKREEVAIAQLRQVVERHSGTKAAGESLMRLGNILYESGKHDEALEAFGRYLQAFPGGPHRVKAAIGKAYSEESKGDLAAAEQTLLAIISSAKGDPLLGEAEIGLARIYEALKKTDEASKLFGQIVEKYPQSQWAQQATERLGSPKSK